MKTKSTAAQAAQAIRNELKAAGIKVRVTSENYSGGNNVNISMTDADPETKKTADAICNKYQYGHFDGMTDCYEYSNKHSDLPQVKYVFVRNDSSDEMKQTIYETLRSGWAGGDSLPKLYTDGCNIHFQGDYISSLVRRIFTSSTDSFWSRKAAA